MLVRIFKIIILLLFVPCLGFGQDQAKSTTTNPIEPKTSTNDQIVRVQDIAVRQPGVGIGFEFGVAFRNYMKSTFKRGNSNYFRLKFRDDQNATFFIHNEEGNFSVEEGSTSIGARQNTNAIGVITGLSDSLWLDLMVGSSSVVFNPIAGTVTSATDSTDPVAEIGVNYIRIRGRVVISGGLSYRQHKLAHGVTVTPSGGSASTITDLSSLNLNIGLAYQF